MTPRDPLRTALLATPILIAIGTIIRRHPRTTRIAVTELAGSIPARIAAVYVVRNLAPEKSALYVQILPGVSGPSICGRLTQTFMKRIDERLMEPATTTTQNQRRAGG